MACHRINELIELLQPEWQREPDMSLVQFVIQLSKEAGYEGALEELSDDVLIYHLKMKNLPKEEMIPGLAKDQDEIMAALLEVNESKQ